MRSIAVVGLLVVNAIASPLQIEERQTACSNNNNLGVQWLMPDYFPNTPDDTDSTFSNFIDFPDLCPTDCNGWTENNPYGDSNTVGPYTTYNVSGWTGADTNRNIYGTPYTSGNQYYSLMHRGYILAPETGKYTVSTGFVDAIVLVWVGQNAYKGYQRANAVLDWSKVRNGSMGHDVTVSLTKGTYTPLRIFYQNAQDMAHEFYPNNPTFNMTIFAPSGKVILGPNTGPSANVLQFTCDGKAPAYPAWKNECPNPC